MANRYHAGEIAVQTQAGVRSMSERVAGGIRDFAPEAAQEFLAERPFVLLGAADESGSVWATLLWGKPGFARFTDARHVRITSTVSTDDPLFSTLQHESEVGLLAIQPETRRRMRVNGRSQRTATGLTVVTEQVYANCPRYITARDIVVNPLEGSRSPTGSVSTQRSESVSAAHRQWIESTDTFFIASAHPNSGADVSHRGGNPDFVQVRDEGKTLLFPDYNGNTMFQTLGNIASTGKAGLLLVDWQTGDLLHVTGTARILWEAPEQSQFPGAERLVEIRIQSVVSRPQAAPVHANGLSALSPFNPQ